MMGNFHFQLSEMLKRLEMTIQVDLASLLRSTSTRMGQLKERELINIFWKSQELSVKTK